MRTAEAPGSTDLTARARIRDAAIAAFARDGFAAGLRAIAADAGVSPALVVHHFGSKDGLRTACDEHVLATIRAAKQEALGVGGDALLTALAGMDDYAVQVGYLIRSLQSGGDLARAFIDHVVADAREYLADAVADGRVRPSRDEPARARYLALSSLGTLMAYLVVDPPVDLGDLGDWLHRYAARIGLPSVELFTDGLLTDRRMLDAYLLYVSDPPAGV